MAAKTILSISNPSVRVDTILHSPAAATVTFTPVVPSNITGNSPTPNTVTESLVDDTVSIYAIP